MSRRAAPPRRRAPFVGLAAVLALGAAAAPALAQPDAAATGLRDLCTDRPGLGTPSCTLDKGHLALEVGLGDWTHDKQGSTRTDTILAGDALLRAGLTDSLEAQVGWTAYGHVRTRDSATGEASDQSRTGDVTLALRRNLRNPDGSGFSMALMPYASLPTGRAPIGAGDWGAGLIAPISVDLGGPSLALTPQVDAATDADGHGRHLGFGAVVGLGLSLGEKLSASAELSLYRDRDPSGHTTQALSGLSAAWRLSANAEVDAGANFGLNSDSPDRELYFGLARRF